MQLLQRRYAVQNQHSLQIVPDRVQGDLGMEAFAHDGCIYQCYAPEEPLDPRRRFEKQRDKLTTDLGKLRKKTTDVKALLGPVIVRRYVLLVPTHDSKELISHAHTKAAEVIGWGLPFIAPDFAIVIETDDSYQTERKDIHAIPTPLIQAVELDEADKLAWAQSNPDLRATAQAKLSNVIRSSSTRDSVLESLTHQLLEGENALDRIKSVQPETYQSLLAEKSRKERLLVLEYSAHPHVSHGLLAKIESDFEAALRERYQTLTPEVAETLAWASVADWLMRCPLDFEVA